MVRMSAIDRFWRPRFSAFSRLGIAIAAMMPMMATTISSSINVKPFSLLIRTPPFLLVSSSSKNRTTPSASDQAPGAGGPNPGSKHAISLRIRIFPLESASPQPAVAARGRAGTLHIPDSPPFR